MTQIIIHSKFGCIEAEPMTCVDISKSVSETPEVITSDEDIVNS